MEVANSNIHESREGRKLMTLRLADRSVVFGDGWFLSGSCGISVLFHNCFDPLPAESQLVLQTGR